MLPRAAVKALRTHNLCRVTGSSGRRREGKVSEPQRPNMSRHAFTFAVPLLLLVVMMCCCGCEAASAVGIVSEDEHLSKWVDIFVPNKTQILAGEDDSKIGVGVSFVSPSLVSAGGVVAVLAEGIISYNPSSATETFVYHSDIVAGYVNAAESWPSLVAGINDGTWRAHTVLSTVNEERHVGIARLPTTIAKGNKLFLLVGSYIMMQDTKDDFWKLGGADIQLVQGEATKSTEGKQSKSIKWGEPKSLLGQIAPQAQGDSKVLWAGGGGSGVLMEDGTFVFPLQKRKENGEFLSMIIYSTDDGSSWAPSKGMLPVGCRGSCITEWERGQIFMITDCDDGQRVYESRDMGTTWTESVRTLLGVWIKSESEFFWDKSLRAGALITATIEGRKVMLYTQKRYPTQEQKDKALYLWVTDNNRSFYVGPVSVDSAVNNTFANALLYSDDELYLSQQRGIKTSTAVSLARLTEELNTIRSVLSNWAQLDASFSESSTPTAGLVGFLSNAASGDTWIDEYRCVNATVTKAAKVHNGFKFTGPGSRAIWPVNSREDNNQYGFVDHNFAIVATVTIHQVPKKSTPLLGASLGEGHPTKIIGLSYSMNKKWETVFNGTKTAQDSIWEPGKEYQVALMLQDGNKGSVYVDGKLVGSSETIPTLEMTVLEISHFYIGGAEGDSDSDLTVKNFFLYNRPLSADELKMVTKREDSVRGGVSWMLLLLLLLGLWGIAALY
ncbi:trans-sialidase [Trypanosoma cruzi cruzi]|uniref:Putative trans-sialidase n=1 Tax=Trypanosoma cruzi TaxID=5693 RepID=A0A2V2UWL0_TRYCR|nr:trans-sialidase [Trypanosoma cruzi cruzi]PWU87198.1 putative trans-sialidase [Trypanosoma cruzi]